MTATLAPRLTALRCDVGPYLILHGATAPQAQALRDRFDFAYTQQVRRGTEMVRETAVYPLVLGHADRLTLPYGLLSDLRKMLPLDVLEYTASPAPATPYLLHRRHADREGQRTALNAYWQHNARDHRGGVLIAPCGAGKSWIGARLIAGAQVRTLVCVHTRDLLEQWREGLAEAFPGQRVGVVGAGRCDVQDLTIGLWQSLRTQARAMSHAFGMVIADECHHVAAETFGDVMTALRARIKVGLTASEQRADGLSPLVTALCGPIVARIEQDDMYADGVVMVPTIRVIRTGWAWDGDAVEDFNGLLAAMVTDETRNALLADLVSRLADDGRRVLALSARVEHLRELTARVNALRPGTAQIITGREKAAERRAAMQAMRAGFPVTFATTALAKEGLNAPLLDTLVWCTPVKNPVTVQQAVGRIQRTGKDTQPLVVDLRDDTAQRRGDLDDLPSSERVCYWQYESRRRVYNSLGARWE